MNSKIRVDYDFDYQEPFIHFTLEEGDVNDKALKHFIEQVNNRGVELVYPAINFDNKNPQLRVTKAQDHELRVVRHFRSFCEESLDPDLFEKFEDIYQALFDTRSALKGKINLII